MCDYNVVIIVRIVHVDMCSGDRDCLELIFEGDEITYSIQTCIRT